MGSALNNGTLAMSADLATSLTGLLSLAIVIGAIILITGVGNRGLQEFVHRWIWQAVLGAICLGSYSAIASSITTNFHP
jgi:F0F1-type ATP synthase membrane subunit a